MTRLNAKISKGFTLIELVVVIVILGILAGGISQFLKFGTQIFAETTTRDQIISSARFIIERLNRDLRHAVPNSVHIDSGCLTFKPFVETTIYTDIPVSPEPATNVISVVKFEQPFSNTWQAVVYPIDKDDVFDPSSDRVVDVNSVVDSSGDKWQLQLTSATQFGADSPTNRMYFIEKNSSVSYCLVGQSIYRNNVLMAQNVISSTPFVVQPATLRRNALVQIQLLFEQNNEQVNFHNEIQIPNVP